MVPSSIIYHLKYLINIFNNAIPYTYLHLPAYRIYLVLVIFPRSHRADAFLVAVLTNI